MQTNVTVKGQVTIPKQVRDRAGLAPGMRVEVANNEMGEVVVRRAQPCTGDADRRRAEMLDRIAGLGALGLRLDEDVDAVMSGLREPLPS